MTRPPIQLMTVVMLPPTSKTFCCTWLPLPSAIFYSSGWLSVVSSGHGLSSKSRMPVMILFASKTHPTTTQHSLELLPTLPAMKLALRTSMPFSIPQIKTTTTISLSARTRTSKRSPVRILNSPKNSLVLTQESIPELSAMVDSDITE